MLPILLLACRSPEEGETPAPGSTGDTGTPPPPGVDVLSAECALDPGNALRATCELTLSEPGLAEVELTDGVEAAVFRAEAEAQQVTVPIWGLTAGETWSFTARAGGTGEVSGEITGGELPEQLLMDATRSGGASVALRHLLVPSDCGPGVFATVLDAQGRVRWYEDFGGLDGDMVQLTEAGTVVVLGDRAWIAERDLLGAELVRRDDFDLPVHHDLFRRGDRIYMLQAEAILEDDGRTYVEDVVVAVDRSGQEVWRWRMDDHFDATLVPGPTTGFWSGFFPGAIDTWHANGLYVTEEHDVIVSLKRHSTVFRISGEDGSVEWLLVGDASVSAFTSSFTFPDAEARFEDQHHPGMLADGTLTVFDNSAARGLAVALDEGAGTATFVGDWPTGLGCPIQSSIFALDEGHVATCGSQHTWVEFDAQGVEIGRTELSCQDGGGMPLMVRGQPLDLWGGWSVGGVTVERLE